MFTTTAPSASAIDAFSSEKQVFSGFISSIMLHWHWETVFVRIIMHDPLLSDTKQTFPLTACPTFVGGFWTIPSEFFPPVKSM